MPLSADHKKLSACEMLRVQQAVGFFNNFGRVNEILNISRSIGNLKREQTAIVVPSKQMITTDPDILQ